MTRKLWMALCATIVLGGAGAAVAPSDASAGWRGGGGFHGGGFHRGGFGGGFGGGFHRGGFGGGFHRAHFGGGFGRGWHGGGFRHVHFGGPRYYGGGFGYPRYGYVRPIAYRPYYRPYYRPIVRVAAFAPAYGYYGPRFGGACVVKQRLRINRWGEPVYVTKRACY